MTEHEETEEASSRFYVLVMIYTQFRYIKGANVGAVTLTGRNMLLPVGGWLGIILLYGRTVKSDR